MAIKSPVSNYFDLRSSIVLTFSGVSTRSSQTARPVDYLTIASTCTLIYTHPDVWHTCKYGVDSMLNQRLNGRSALIKHSVPTGEKSPKLTAALHQVLCYLFTRPNAVMHVIRVPKHY